jgi:signal transduction histidine kinase
MEQPSRAPEFLESAARLRMLSRLAGVLAHEFRNPLTTIFLHADILEDALRRLESNQRLQLLHFLRVMREEAGRIDDLIQQYFWLPRRPDLKRQPEDLAMPHGGVLRLRGQRLGHQLCLEVSDTGCGMLATQLCGLFQPFQTTKAENLGLGLYVAHEIVTAHDGVIKVGSTPGAGTTVRLTFPTCPGSGPR